MSKEIQSHILATFQLKTFLGSGAYGHVWKVLHKTSGREYALKKIFDAFQNDIDAQRTYREVSILHQLDHQNVVKLQWAIKAQNGRDLYLVFEFVQTDLHSIIGQNMLGPSHIRFVAYQLCKVLKYLHSAQLIHRDIKTSNILLDSNCEIKLCDFGLVRSLLHEQDVALVLSEDVATRWYRSPEMLLGSQHYGKPTDMWSVGCVVAELVNGEPLFPGNSNLEQIQKVLEFTGTPNKQLLASLDLQSAQALIQKLRVKKKPTKLLLGQCDKQIKDLLLRMLQLDPSKRITAEQALELDCFQTFRGKVPENTCKKFIFTEVDENSRLGLQDYRRLIYRDIERRYPTLNKSTPMPRIYRTYHSVNSKIEWVGKKQPKPLCKKENLVHSLYQTLGESHNNSVSVLGKRGREEREAGGKENTEVLKPLNKTFYHQQDAASKIYKRAIRRNPWNRQQ